MARRTVTSSVNCAEPLCREMAHFEYDSIRERTESERRRRDHPWRCYRHSHKDEVLSAARPAREVALVAVRRNDRMTWQGAHSSLVHGPGFRAIADDFPEGTRLVVIAFIELLGEEDAPNG